MHKKYLLYPMMAILALCSCKKKSEVSASVSHGTDIYLAGTFYTANDNDIAVYWKNGTLVLLGDTTAATDQSASTTTAIAVNGADVYVSGSYRTAKDVWVACYWKNGRRISLGDSTFDSFATGVALNGADVYIAGYHGNLTSDVQAGYWKNGVLIPLPSPNLIGAATSPDVGSIAVSGSDVYVTGDLNVPGILTAAICWKNGAVQFLGDTTAGGNSLAGPIAFYNSDVYIAGQAYVPSVGTSVAAYWKNGKTVQLPYDSSYSYIGGIAVNETGVYLAGYRETTEAATIWTNGMITTLGNDGYKIGSGGPIVLDGADIYVAGGLSDGSKVTSTMVYWKNGTLVTTGIHGSLNAMVVVSH